MKIFKCETCGNITVKLVDAGVPLMCCGKPMVELKAGTSDGAAEKHVPAFTLDGDSLSVVIGEVEHPMSAEHYIQFILVEQDGKVQYQTLTADAKPHAKFHIDGSKPFAVYEYCNLHGLWKIEK